MTSDRLAEIRELLDGRVIYLEDAYPAIAELLAEVERLGSKLNGSQSKRERDMSHELCSLYDALEAEREERDHLSAELEGWSRQLLKCDSCGELAICIGAYKDPQNIGFACDDCCGHGCEDGWCEMLSSNPLPRYLFSTQRRLLEAEQERDQLKATEMRLRKERRYMRELYRKRLAENRRLREALEVAKSWVHPGDRKFAKRDIEVALASGEG